LENSDQRRYVKVDPEEKFIDPTSRCISDFLMRTKVEQLCESGSSAAANTQAIVVEANIRIMD